jgi:Flp pilus assembly protein TadG
MKRLVLDLWRDSRAAAAVEMALVTPLLLILMFGALETGKYFLDEHVVIKAVRDGARFASRQSFAGMTCDSSPTNLSAIKNQVRYGKTVVGTSDVPRLSYWDSDTTITVTVACLSNAPDSSGVRAYSGVWYERDQVPYVTVAATVPYEPLVAAIGVNFDGLNVGASNQAPVVGI